MARVHFTVRRHLPLPARVAFDELVDWHGHAEWVPMTRVVIESGDGGAGTTFVATTGLGPLALPDRMRVESLDATQMTVHIVKIGPVLTGDVRLSVESMTDDSSDITWDEDVRVPLLPGFLSKPVGAVARKAFEVSIDRMAKRARQRV
ncbi:MAG: SRPBCC family protein [Deltaproteobacteria bacterium]|nr:SRPBCC family protein [Deltaproteobacteria bacterium]